MNAKMFKYMYQSKAINSTEMADMSKIIGLVY